MLHKTGVPANNPVVDVDQKEETGYQLLASSVKRKEAANFRWDVIPEERDLYETGIEGKKKKIHEHEHKVSMYAG